MSRKRGRQDPLVVTEERSFPISLKFQQIGFITFRQTCAMFGFLLEWLTNCMSSIVFCLVQRQSNMQVTAALEAIYPSCNPRQGPYRLFCSVLFLQVTAGDIRVIMPCCKTSAVGCPNYPSGLHSTGPGGTTLADDTMTLGENTDEPSFLVAIFSGFSVSTQASDYRSPRPSRCSKLRSGAPPAPHPGPNLYVSSSEYSASTSLSELCFHLSKGKTH